MSVKGDWSRVEDIKAWDTNYDNIFKKKKSEFTKEEKKFIEEHLEEHSELYEKLAEEEQKEKKHEQDTAPASKR